MDICTEVIKQLSPLVKFLRRRVPSLLIIAAYHAMSLLDVYASNATFNEEQCTAIGRIGEVLMNRLCDIYSDLAGMFRKDTAIESDDIMWFMVSSASFHTLVHPYLQAHLLSSTLLVSLIERLVFSDEVVVTCLPWFVAFVVIKVQLELTPMSAKTSIISHACLVIKRSLNYDTYYRIMTLSALLLQESPLAMILIRCSGIGTILDVGLVQALPLRNLSVFVEGSTLFGEEQQYQLAKRRLMFAIQVSDRRLVWKLVTEYPNLSLVTGALHESLRLHDIGMCKMLVESEARFYDVRELVNDSSFTGGVTPLMVLCMEHHGKSNHIGMVLFRSLVSKGASMNKVDSLGRSLLDICVSSGCDEAFTGFVRSLWYRRTQCFHLVANLGRDDMGALDSEDFEWVEDNVRRAVVYAHRRFGRIMRGINPVDTPPPYENPNNAIAQQIVNLPAEDYYIPL